MEIITFLLLLLLFIAGLLHLLPSKKIQSFLFNKALLPSTPPNPAAPQSNSVSGSSDKKEEIRRVFSTFDKNGDGFITRQELRDSLKNIRILMTEKEVEEMVAKVDSNGDGLIDFEEFCVLCKAMEGENREEKEEEEEEEEHLKEAFDVFDRDNDGLISVEELGSVLSSLGLKEGRKVDNCKEMIKKVDMDGDGMVNFDEFKRMMRSGGKLLSVY